MPSWTDTEKLTPKQAERLAKALVRQDFISRALGVPETSGKASEGKYVFDIKPISKPRMTQRDKWLKPPRKCVAEYWSFKDAFVLNAKQQNFTMPEANYHLTFYLEMPKSWTKKKKAEMDGKPHQQKPDKDNLEKAVLDALLSDDSKVWDGRVSKYWSRKPRIEVKF